MDVPWKKSIIFNPSFIRRLEYHLFQIVRLCFVLGTASSAWFNKENKTLYSTLLKTLFYLQFSPPPGFINYIYIATKKTCVHVHIITIDPRRVHAINERQLLIEESQTPEGAISVSRRVRHHLDHHQAGRSQGAVQWSGARTTASDVLLRREDRVLR